MYLALARKYRPQTFADLIGQASVSQTLQNAIAMNKVYPALIFSGMKGVGKTSTARILAKALNCDHGPAKEPCNQCPTCQEITEDRSTDYIEIDGASNNGVGEVRSLRETVRYKPSRNRYRIVVIDEVHMLSSSAWNALLKTVEEPPEHTYFILATTDFHKIPATIVSRCQHFEFKRIPVEVIKTVLREICGKEKVVISDYSLFLIAKSAEGSLRDAKKILDQAIAISSGDVADESVVQILGIIDEEIFIALTRAFLSADRHAIIHHIGQLTEAGTDLRFFFGEYLKFIRDLLIVKTIENSEGLHNLNPDNLPALREILRPVSETDLLRYFNAAKEMEQTIRNTESPSIMLELLFIKLSYFPQLAPIEEIVRQLQQNPHAVRTPPAAMPASPPAAPPPVEGGAKAPPPHAAEVPPAGDWLPAFRQRIAEEKPRLGALLAGSDLRLENRRLLLTPGADHAVKPLTDQAAWLGQVATRLAGREVPVEIVSPPPGSGQPGPAEAIEQIKKDPAITGLQNMLRGKLIAVEAIKEKDDA